MTAAQKLAAHRAGIPDESERRANNWSIALLKPLALQKVRAWLQANMQATPEQLNTVTVKRMVIDPYPPGWKGGSQHPFNEETIEIGKIEE